MNISVGWCLDCNEMTYIHSNQNGVFKNKDGGKVNHPGHRVYRFEHPNKYSPPIRMVLMKLEAEIPLSDNEIILFKLAIQLGDLDKFCPDASGLQAELAGKSDGQLNLFAEPGGSDGSEG